MATHYQSGAWNSSSILQGYGLMAVIGAHEPTREDVKRLNSRSGGEHAGHGNWMQTFNPKPVIKNGPPTKVYEYGQGSEVVIKSRLPGLPQRKVSKFKGLKKTPNVILKIGASRDVDGVQETVNVPITDDILERNRRLSDASMKSKSSSSSGSDIAPSSIYSQVSSRYVAPTPFVSTTNNNEAKNITNMIYGPADDSDWASQKSNKGKRSGRNTFTFKPSDTDDDMV